MTLVLLSYVMWWKCGTPKRAAAAEGDDTAAEEVTNADDRPVSASNWGGGKHGSAGAGAGADTEERSPKREFRKGKKVKSSKHVPGWMSEEGGDDEGEDPLMPPAHRYTASAPTHAPPPPPTVAAAMNDGATGRALEMMKRERSMIAEGEGGTKTMGLNTLLEMKCWGVWSGAARVFCMNPG